MTVAHLAAVAAVLLLLLIRVGKDRSEHRRLTLRTPVWRHVLMLCAGEPDEVETSREHLLALDPADRAAVEDAEVFVRHHSMMFRPRYGVIGMVTMPWFFLFEMLAPIVEVLGFAYFIVLMVGLAVEHLFFPTWDVVDVPIVVLLLTASILFAVFVTLVSLLAEEVSLRRYRGLPDLFRAMAAAVEENVGYRQFNAWWRLGGIVEVLRRSRHDWGDMQRKGFGST